MSDLNIAFKRNRNRLQRRRMRVHKGLTGSIERPRLVVYRSNRHIYAQLIDDTSGRTIIGTSTLNPAMRERIAATSSKIEQARIVGERLAGLAGEKGIVKVAFDRNGRKYHGRVKALADGARAGGLEF